MGLVELLIAMMVLNIGLLALLTTLLSGVGELSRAGHSATAGTLADSQMELYRKLTYSVIALDPTSIPASAPSTTDAAYVPSQVTAACPGAVASNPQCNASRTVTGPDHGSYRVDTYIAWVTPPNGRALKQITVVVRDGAHLGSRPLARRSSWFDASTGT